MHMWHYQKLKEQVGKSSLIAAKIKTFPAKSDPTPTPLAVKALIIHKNEKVIAGITFNQDIQQYFEV